MTEWGETITAMLPQGTSGGDATRRIAAVCDTNAARAVSRAAGIPPQIVHEESFYEQCSKHLRFPHTQ